MLLTELIDRTLHRDHNDEAAYSLPKGKQSLTAVLQPWENAVQSGGEMEPSHAR